MPEREILRSDLMHMILQTGREDEQIGVGRPNVVEIKVRASHWYCNISN